MPKPDIAHPASFWRHLAEFEREEARKRRKIPPELARRAGHAINAAVARGAFSPDRIDHYASQVILAGSKAEAEEAIASIRQLWGPRGTGPGGGEGEGDYDDGDLSAYAHLWPPQAGEEREWQAAWDAAEQRAIAASARQKAEDDEDFAVLFRPKTPEEADRQAARRQRIAAARQAAGDLDEEDEESYEEYLSLVHPGARP